MRLEALQEKKSDYLKFHKMEEVKSKSKSKLKSQSKEELKSPTSKAATPTTTSSASANSVWSHPLMPLPGYIHENILNLPEKLNYTRVKYFTPAAFKFLGRSVMTCSSCETAHYGANLGLYAAGKYFKYGKLLCRPCFQQMRKARPH